MSFLDSDLISSGANSIQDTLLTWGNEVVDKLKKSLRAKISEGTSDGLQNSMIVLPIEIGESRFTLMFQSKDYWKFIDKGVSGAGGNKADGSAWVNKGAGSPFSYRDKKPPVNFSSLDGSSLLQWSFNKGYSEYAVRESVFHSGIKATHFWTDVINKSLVKDLVKRLEKAGAKNVELIIAKEFK